MQKIIVSKANEALVVPRTEGMMRLFPEGKPLDDKSWVIKHGMAEYTLLRRLGFRLPSPINCYYDWAAGKPFDVQRFTCDLLTGNPRAYVLNDMGTGKTRSALWAWDFLRNKGYAGKLLVVAPLSTLWLVWAHEVKAALPHRKVEVLHGSKKNRLYKLNHSNADIFIVNHDGLKVIKHDLDVRLDIDTLVIDELATYRNHNARSNLMLKFAERMKFVWGLTGSPMPHEPTDVWMQCRILTPHTVPKRLTFARDMLMTHHSEFVWLPKPDAVDRAYSWMQPAVRFTLDDVVELPDLIERSIDVPLTDQQEKLYIKIANELVAYVKAKMASHEINAVNAAALVNKLVQISGGYVYSTQSETVVLDVAPRQQMLADLIRQSTGKVLVFFPFRHMVVGVSQYLANLKDDDAIEHAVVHGDVHPTQRNIIFDEFQSTPKYKALLAHPVCMRHGLTLTAADTIIWYCPISDYEVYEQANARIRRVGQKHRQQVIHLQSTPAERRVYAMLRRKEKVQDQLLALFEDATIAATNAA